MFFTNFDLNTAVLLRKMEKKNLRQLYRKKRAALSIQERQRLSERILKQFESLALPVPALVMSYQPIAGFAEFSPAPVENNLSKRFPGVQFCYPKINGDVMDAFTFIPGKSNWVRQEWGIPEITGGKTVVPAEIDMILIPLLVTDRKGYRVGYGKGFYDRFMEQCPAEVLTIGFSFFDPVAQIDGLHKMDLKLRYCVTPQQVFKF